MQYDANIVQSTADNFTHAWHLLRGATHNCNACHAALQCGPRQFYGMGHVRDILLFQHISPFL